jgi:hypothetical protein
VACEVNQVQISVGVGKSQRPRTAAEAQLGASPVLTRTWMIRNASALANSLLYVLSRG